MVEKPLSQRLAEDWVGAAATPAQPQVQTNQPQEESLSDRLRRDWATPIPPTPDVDPNQSTSVAGDIGREFGIGLNQLGALAGVALQKAGAEETGAAVKQHYQARQAELTSQLSPEQKAARETEFLSGDLTIPTGFRKVAGVVAQSAPSMALGMGVGGALTKGLMTAGVGATTAGVVGGAVGEGTVGAGLNYLDTYDQALAIPQEQMAASPEYQAAYSSITEGTPEERAALAREKVASALALQSAGIVGAATAVLGAPSGIAYARLLGGETGKTALRTIAKQAGLETLQEAPQSVVETYATGEVLGQVAPQLRATPDQLFESAVAGAIVGGAMGGAMGGVAQAGTKPEAATLAARAREVAEFKATNPQAEISDDEYKTYVATGASEFLGESAAAPPTEAVQEEPIDLVEPAPPAAVAPAAVAPAAVAPAAVAPAAVAPAQVEEAPIDLTEPAPFELPAPANVTLPSGEVIPAQQFYRMLNEQLDAKAGGMTKEEVIRSRRRLAKEEQQFFEVQAIKALPEAERTAADKAKLKKYSQWLEPTVPAESVTEQKEIVNDLSTVSVPRTETRQEVQEPPVRVQGDEVATAAEPTTLDNTGENWFDVASQNPDLSKRDVNLMGVAGEIKQMAAEFKNMTPEQLRQRRIDNTERELTRLNGTYTLHGDLARDNRFLQLQTLPSGKLVLQYGDEVFQEKSSKKAGSKIKTYESVAAAIDDLYGKPTPPTKETANARQQEELVPAERIGTDAQVQGVGVDRLIEAGEQREGGQAGGGDSLRVPQEEVATAPTKEARIRAERRAKKEGKVERPATEIITPSEDTPAGTNSAGEPLYERADGSRYRMRTDRTGRGPYPDFGGDLAPVTAAHQPAPTQALELPRLPRGYQRQTFTVADPTLANYTFVEDTSTKGKKTLLSVKAGETVAKPVSKFIADKVNSLPRTEAKFAETGPTPIQTLSEVIARETGKPVPYGTFTRVAPPKGQEAVFAALATTLKKDIIFFESKNAPMRFDGVTGIVDGAIFININTPKPHLAIAGHEFLHDLKNEDPEAYGSFREVVLDTIPQSERDSMWEALNAKRKSEGRRGISREAVDEELIADFFGSQFTTREFWAKVERRNPEGFASLVQRLVDFLGRMAQVFTGKERADIVKAQDAAAEALARYIRRNPEAAVEAQGVVEPTVFSEPVTPGLLKSLGLPADLPLANDYVTPFGFESLPQDYQKAVLKAESNAYLMEKSDPVAAKERHNAIAKSVEKKLRDAQAGPIAIELSRIATPEGAVDRRGQGAGVQRPEPKTLSTYGLGVRAMADSLIGIDGSSSVDELTATLAALGKAGRVEEVNDVINALKDLGYRVTGAKDLHAAIVAQVAKEDAGLKFAESFLAAPRKNMEAGVAAVRSGQVTTAALPGVLKVTPLGVVVDLFKDTLPQVQTFYRAMTQRDAVANGIVTDFGLVGKELAATKDTAKRVADVAAISSFNQMWPQKSIFEQDWIPEPMRGAEGAKAETKEALLKAAQTSWENAGMQATVGKTFREAYAESKLAFDALKTDDLKDRYLEAVDLMSSVRQREKDAAQALIEEVTAVTPDMSAEKQAELEALRADQIEKLDMAYNTLKGAYWAFYRKGDYTLTYVNKATGQREYSTYQTVFERDYIAKSLVGAGLVDEATMKLGKKEEKPRGEAGIPVGYNAALGKAIEDKAIADAVKGIDPNDAAAIEDATAQAKATAQTTIQTMNEVWLRFQPESSAAKSMMRRKNIRGWDSDMVRGFLEYGQTHAAKVAQMEQGRKVEAILNDMATDIKGRQGDTTREQAVLNDLRARDSATRSTTTSWLAKKLGAWTTFKYMTSPSIALVQMTQLGILTLPKMATLRVGGKEVGGTAAAKALAKGMQSAFSTAFGREAMYDDVEVNTIFDSIHAVVTSEMRSNPETAERYAGVPLGTPIYTKAELQAMINTLSPYQKRLLALHEAMDRGLLDISLAHEVNDIVGGGDPNSVKAKTFDLMMTWMRESEKASRKAAILSSFEVGAGDTDFFAAMETVSEVVDNTLFNYSKSAKGVLLQGDLVRVLTTFQTFRINAAAKLMILARQSMKGADAETRTAAKRELIGIFGMSGLLAGGLGMPLAPIVFQLFDNLVGDDGDEPAEEQFRKWLEENFGETAAGVALEGVPSLLGTSLSRRIGLGDVIGTGPDVPARLVGDGAFNWYATQLAGPSYSMAAGYAKGFNEIFTEGEVMKGLQSSMPKPVGDMLKAVGYATEGVKTSRGKRLLAADQIPASEIILQALGFAPYEISRLKTEEFVRTNMGTEIGMRRGQVIEDFAKAFMDKDDTADEREAIMEFNKKFPLFPIGASDLTSSVRAMQKGELGVDTLQEMKLKAMTR